MKKINKNIIVNNIETCFNTRLISWTIKKKREIKEAYDYVADNNILKNEQLRVFDDCRFTVEVSYQCEGNVKTEYRVITSTDDLFKTNHNEDIAPPAKDGDNTGSADGKHLHTRAMSLLNGILHRFHAFFKRCNCAEIVLSRTIVDTYNYDGSSSRTIREKHYMEICASHENDNHGEIVVRDWFSRFSLITILKQFRQACKPAGFLNLKKNIIPGKYTFIFDASVIVELLYNYIRKVALAKNDLTLAVPGGTTGALTISLADIPGVYTHGENTAPTTNDRLPVVKAGALVNAGNQALLTGLKSRCIVLECETKRLNRGTGFDDAIEVVNYDTFLIDPNSLNFSLNVRLGQGAFDRRMVFGNFSLTGNLLNCCEGMTFFTDNVIKNKVNFRHEVMSYVGPGKVTLRNLKVV